MYADRMTDSMRRAIGEMERRRAKQIAYNTEHGITPRTILKTREEILQATLAAGDETRGGASRARDAAVPTPGALAAGLAQTPREIVEMLEAEMEAAAAALDFELAAELRDRLEDLRAQWGLPQLRTG
jgi:excinuclease ABC subunit B